MRKNSILLIVVKLIPMSASFTLSFGIKLSFEIVRVNAVTSRRDTNLIKEKSRNDNINDMKRRTMITFIALFESCYFDSQAKLKKKKKQQQLFSSATSCHSYHVI